MNQKEFDRHFISASELMKRAKITAKRLQRLREAGRLPEGLLCNGRHLWLRKPIEQFIEQWLHREKTIRALTK